MDASSTSPLGAIDNIGIAVQDLAAESTFFQEKLGLDVDVALESEPPSATVRLGAQYLYVFQTDSIVRAAQRSPGLVENPPGLDHISFAVTDVDGAYATLKARGVEFDGEPESMETWGIRLVAFRDPEGNSFFLVERL